MTRRSLAVRAAVACLAPICLAPASSSAAANASVSEPSGSSSSAATPLGGDGSSGPEFAPGIHNVTLAGNDSLQHFTVTRQADETLWISANSTTRLDPTSPNAPALSLAAHTADGTSCDSMAGPGSVSSPMLNAGLVLSPVGGTDPAKCRNATTFTVDISSSGSGSRPAQVLVLREPRVTSSSNDISEDFNSDLSLFKAKTGPKVDGSSDFDKAPEIKEGTTLTDVPANGHAIFKVYVGWEQHLAVTANMPRTGVSYSAPVPMNARIRLFNPARAAVDDISGIGTRTSQPLDASDPSLNEISVSTPMVFWNNRAIGTGDFASTQPGDYSSTTVERDSIAGWYYVVLETTPKDASDARYAAGEVPAAISVSVDGPAESGPSYAGQSDVVTQPTLSNDPRTPWERIPLAAAALAALAFATWKARRASRG